MKKQIVETIEYQKTLTAVEAIHSLLEKQPFKYWKEAILDSKKAKQLCFEEELSKICDNEFVDINHLKNNYITNTFYQHLIHKAKQYVPYNLITDISHLVILLDKNLIIECLDNYESRERIIKDHFTIYTDSDKQNKMLLGIIKIQDIMREYGINSYDIYQVFRNDNTIDGIRFKQQF